MTTPLAQHLVTLGTRDYLLGETVCLVNKYSGQKLCLDARGAATQDGHVWDVGALKYIEKDLHTSTWSLYEKPVRFGDVHYGTTIYLKCLADSQNYAPENWLTVKGETDSGNRYDVSTSLEDRGEASAFIIESVVEGNKGTVRYCEPFYLKHMVGDEAVYLDIRGDGKNGCLFDVSASTEQDWAETVFPRLRTSLELRAIPSLARWFADQPAQTHLRFGSFTSLIREVNPSISSSDIIRLWYVLEKENSAGEPLVHVDELLRHMLCHAGRNDSLPSKDSIATSDVSRPSVVSARSRPGVDGHPNNLRLDPALVRRY